MSALRVALLKGGPSLERQVSLRYRAREDVAPATLRQRELRLAPSSAGAEYPAWRHGDDVLASLKRDDVRAETAAGDERRIRTFGGKRGRMPRSQPKRFANDPHLRHALVRVRPDRTRLR